ncbi:hypothetical protein HAX54_043761 [Datura stramonium]|uniref:Uncharacterized protein n=1 Tax=Datura stramonium TaxID=4076 RepID=A0ABS8SP28_DATST|nr:hypothetical protein [Datura stramonium]
MENLIEKALTGESNQLSALSNYSQNTLDKLELLCDESFSEIIKEEEEEEEEVVGTSHASSTNCTVFSLNERNRLCSHSTDDGEEEDGNAIEAVSDANKLRRVQVEQ